MAAIRRVWWRTGLAREIASRERRSVPEPIVLLHGFAGTTASWDPVRATQRLEATPVPVPGHRAPIADDWDGNLALLAARVPRDAIAIGYSLGARLALGLLATDRVRAAVLIGVNPGLTGDDERRARAVGDAQWAALLRTEGLAAFLDAWEAQPLFASQSRAPAALRAARRQQRMTLDPESLARSLETTGLAVMPDYRAALLARASCVHLVVGAEDDAYVARARSLIADAPALGFDVIAGSGHDPTLEQPERLADVLAAATGRLDAESRFG
jgi:2-succinyl-6-hydroxy-2,4-cyclohexadiene-1-carboxylate synthase